MSRMIHVRLHYYYLSLKMRPLQSLKLDPTGLRQHILLKAPNYSIPAKGCSKRTHFSTPVVRQEPGSLGFHGVGRTIGT